MLAGSKIKLKHITIIYWVLLCYIVAALVWWFIALSKQNNTMTNLRLGELQKDQPGYTEKALEILAAKKRKDVQYIGEGVIFLGLILVGAAFVYSSLHKQIKLVNQQQNFMMAITHELKTPIAVTQINLETLQKRKLQEAQQSVIIKKTLQEANRLNALCNNILLAAQLDAGYALNKVDVNFTELLEEMLHQFKDRFPERSIQQDIQEAVYVDGEDVLLQMLVNNLLENANKYSPKHGIINVQLTEQANLIRLRIEDEGEGIPITEQQKIFDKFYRIGSENTRTAKGTGLGLYLCKKIVKDHGGSIKVENKNGGSGAIFTVELKASAHDKA